MVERRRGEAPAGAAPAGRGRPSAGAAIRATASA